VELIKKQRLGVLGSGKGSNMVALANASAAAHACFEVALVISDVPDAGILARAQALGIPTCYIAPGKFRTKLDADRHKKASK